MKIKLTQEEMDTMSYDDVANIILQAEGKKMKTPDLFKKVIKVLELPEEEFTNGIGDFFELLVTDKRFIMLENGFWDLKINHSSKVIMDDDEDDDEDIDFLDSEEDEELEEDESEVNYDEDSVEDDDEDDLKDLVIINESDEEDNL